MTRIAVIGKWAITPEFAAGASVAKHLARFPRSQIVNLHYQSLGHHYLFPHIPVKWEDLRKSPFRSPLRKTINQCLTTSNFDRHGGLLYKTRIYAPLDIDWEKWGGPPDLIYSLCGSAEDFSFLHHVYRQLPRKVPIVQHFFDVDFSDYSFLVSLYQELFPAMTALWAQGRGAYYAVKHFSPFPPEIVSASTALLPKLAKTKHRGISKNFYGVVPQTISSEKALLLTQKIWGLSQKRFGRLGKIQKATGGFQKADLGIIPFSAGSQDLHGNYAVNFNEYCANGLPLVVISGPTSEPARFTEEHELGIVIDPSDLKVAERKLSHFIWDKNWRAECGKKARFFAENNFDLTSYQDDLFVKLKKIARTPFPQKIKKWRLLG